MRLRSTLLHFAVLVMRGKGLPLVVVVLVVVVRCGEMRCDAAAAGGGGGVLSLGGCAAKHIEGCLVGVMKPQELLYAAVDYYIKKKRKKARF